MKLILHLYSFYILQQFLFHQSRSESISGFTRTGPLITFSGGGNHNEENRPDCNCPFVFLFFESRLGFAFLSVIAFKEDFEDFWNSKIRKISLGDTVQDFWYRNIGIELSVQFFNHTPDLKKQDHNGPAFFIIQPLKAAVDDRLLKPKNLYRYHNAW